MPNSKRRKGFDYGNQWSDDGLEEMILPSGKIVLLRTPNLARMAKAGAIPNNIIGTVEKFIIGGINMLVRDVPNITAEGQEPGKALIRTAELNDYIDAVCVAAIAEPVFVFPDESGGIPISVMDSDDKFAVWDWGVGLTAAVARFRGNGVGTLVDVGATSDSDPVREESESVSGIEQSA